MPSLNLGQLRERYVARGRALPVEIERQLLADPRPGAQALLALVERRRRANRRRRAAAAAHAAL
jgi:hypothetical protein